MKLDLNVVRDLLITLEHALYVNEKGYVQFLYPELVGNSEHGIENDSPDIVRLGMLMKCEPLNKHTYNETIYAIQKLEEAGYITVTSEPLGNHGIEYSFRQTDGLTFSGHQYLANIRDDKIWSKIEKRLSMVSNSAAFDVVMQIASLLIQTTGND